MCWQVTDESFQFIMSTDALNLQLLYHSLLLNHPWKFLLLLSWKWKWREYLSYIAIGIKLVLVFFYNVSSQTPQLKRNSTIALFPDLFAASGMRKWSRGLGWGGGDSCELYESFQSRIFCTDRTSLRSPLIKLVISYVEIMCLGADTVIFLENSFKRMAVNGTWTNIVNRGASLWLQHLVNTLSDKIGDLFLIQKHFYYCYFS